MQLVDDKVYYGVKAVWKVEPYTKTGKPALKITCPSCGSVAIVAKQWKTSMTTTRVRPCTYCWALAYVAPKRAPGSAKRK